MEDRWLIDGRVDDGWIMNGWPRINDGWMIWTNG